MDIGDNGSRVPADNSGDDAGDSAAEDTAEVVEVEDIETAE